jgi:hypothetical protein
MKCDGFSNTISDKDRCAELSRPEVTESDGESVPVATLPSGGFGGSDGGNCKSDGFCFSCFSIHKKKGTERVGKSCEREEDASREEREREWLERAVGVWAPHCHMSFFYVGVGVVLPPMVVYLSGL